MTSASVFSQWTRTKGPQGVAISSLAAIDGTIYAGTEVNGVYVSSDDGLTWTARNSGIETLEVTAIVSEPGYLFAGTFGGGVFRSTDRGQSWIAPSNGANFAVTSLVIDGPYIFAGTISDGVQRSDDNGETWTERLSGFLGFGAVCKSGDKVFASASSYTYVTTDHGETWSNVASLEGAIIFSYYCEGSMILAGGQSKIYRSTDNGSTFMPIDLNFNFGIVNIYSITAIGSTLYVATSYDGVYQSIDNGTTWTPANAGMGPKDVRAITVSDASTLIAGTHYVGMYRSADLGLSWNKSVTGFPAGSSILSLLVDKSIVFAGTRDGAYRSDDGGDNWVKLGGANDTLNYGTVWAMCELDGNIYASMQLYFNTAVYKSSDNGANWIRCPGAGLPGGTFFMKGLVASGNNIIAGTDEGIYYSFDQGANWYPANVQNLNVTSLAASGNFVYAAVPSGFGVYRSADNGVSWTVSLQSSVDYVEVAAIDNYAFAGAFFGGARYSSNSGGTWFASSGFPPDASVFALGPVGNGMVLAGTDLAPSWIYASFNNGASYSPYSEGLSPRASVEAIAVSESFMFAGTDYNGVWRRENPFWVSIADTPEELPGTFSLAQNYPNPFNPTTVISYQLSVVSEVELSVYDLQGRKVRTLVSERQAAGSYQVAFNAEGLSSGIYFYRLVAGGMHAVRKMILLQ